jgi:hypothetical protein
MVMAKLMVSIRDESYRLLSFEARERGITIQELIRAVIVPEWVRGGHLASLSIENDPLQSVSIDQEESEIRPISSRHVR